MKSCVFELAIMVDYAEAIEHSCSNESAQKTNPEATWAFESGLRKEAVKWQCDIAIAEAIANWQSDTVKGNESDDQDGGCVFKTTQDEGLNGLNALKTLVKGCKEH